ncbi:MAG: endonuclease/exonuclease/phosphatase family protein [Planctomycetes bacterium]|nr:endonuclease/exonuclease/phosphatase family protein [Planctomycetota bacterium]
MPPRPTSWRAAFLPAALFLAGCAGAREPAAPGPPAEPGQPPMAGATAPLWLVEDRPGSPPGADRSAGGKQTENLAGDLVVGSFNAEWYGVHEKSKSRKEEKDDDRLSEEVKTYAARCQVLFLQEVVVRLDGKFFDDPLPVLPGRALHVAAVTPRMKAADFKEQQVCAVYYDPTVVKSVSDFDDPGNVFTRYPIVVSLKNGMTLVGVHFLRLDTANPTDTTIETNQKHTKEVHAVRDKKATLVIGDFNDHQGVTWEGYERWHWTLRERAADPMHLDWCLWRQGEIDKTGYQVVREDLADHDPAFFAFKFTRK